MREILNLVDEFINFEKTASTMAVSSPYYKITKIHSSQTKNRIKSLLATQKQEDFYNYLIQQKQMSKALKQNMQEHELLIDLGKLIVDDVDDLKFLYMVSYKNSVNATFDKTKQQIDLMILNNNKMIKDLLKTSKKLANLKCDMVEIKTQSAQETIEEIEDLIYLLKIKNELFKYIY